MAVSSSNMIRYKLYMYSGTYMFSSEIREDFKITKNNWKIIGA